MVLPDSHRISRVPWYLGNEIKSHAPFVYRTFTSYRRPFHTVRLDTRFVTLRLPREGTTFIPTTPTTQRSRALTCDRFRLFPVRSPLLRESRLLSLPEGTEMVHFPSLAPPLLWIQRGVTRHYPGRVSPFGHPRIEACLQLPEAYRSLLRPSSPSCAKASTECP
jgi:hypothetical protein